ncbi:hypothetical protein Gpo141_00014206 [Globisporangium polare]
MKFLTAATTVFGIACLALVADADQSFKPPLNSSTLAVDAPFKKIKTTANFSAIAAKMGICPGGDCITGQAINLALSRLEEIDSTSRVVVKADGFNQSNGLWTEFMQTSINNVSMQSTMYATTLKVNGTLTTIAFALTTSIFATNTTVKNGNQSLSVPAGGLKFTLSVAGWNFKNTTNKLRFAIAVKAKGRGVNATAPANPVIKKKNGTEASVDRIDFGEGMFMDAPSNAVLDGVDTNISASLMTSGTLTEYIWVFPSFKKSLHYDPVIGSDNTTMTTPAPTATTKTPTTTTKTPPVTKTSAVTKSPSSGSAASSTSAAVGLLFTTLSAIAAYALY